MVLKPEHIHVSKSMRKWMRKTQFSVTFDYAFERVVDACGSTVRAGQVQAESWITPAIKEAYTNLFRSGYAHSVEVWRGSELVGGLYGVALGRMFFGESMFSLADNGSKLAFIHLAQQLQAWGFVLIDCQMHTHHLSSLGAAEIEMAEFQAYLDHNLTFGVDSCWELVLE
jgi:leucyl/phenylalanyl-tRNA--protein transferase